MKLLYDQLATQTLSRGISVAWSAMEADDTLRAVSAARLIYGLRPKSILEVASGYGFVTKHIVGHNPGVPITCLELAAPFCRELKAQGYEVIEDDLITAKLNRTWDVVTIMQVLEHLPDWWALVAVLKKAVSWAERYLFVEIPEGGTLDGERHILALTGEKISQVMMRDVGLCVLRFQRIPPQGRQCENGYTGMVQIVGAIGWR